MAETALVTQKQGGGIVEMDTGSAQDMARRLMDMKQKLGLVQQFFKDVMEKDVDYGVIPGTNKPTLYKPGAEKLCELYNFSPTIAAKNEERDIDTGYYRAEVTVRLTHRSTGTVIAEGIGEANTYESRYRWRWVPEWKLPAGIDTDGLQAEERESKNGNKFMMYRMENDDLHSLWNTVLKMAKKRALVDATLSATRSSGIFTQSEDEMEAWVEQGDDVHAGEPYDGNQSQPPKQSPARNRGNRGGNRNGSGRSSGPSNPNAPITDNQKRAFFGIGKGKNLQQDEVKALVAHISQKDSIDELTMGEASEIIDIMQKTDREELLAMIGGGDEDFDISDDDLPFDQGDLFGGDGSR